MRNSGDMKTCNFVSGKGNVRGKGVEKEINIKYTN
jgi:hypothetical protein